MFCASRFTWYPEYNLADATLEVVEAIDKRMSDVDTVVEQLLEPVLKLKKSLITIWDAESGAGCISRALSRRFPHADICGVDYSEVIIAKAKSASKTQGIKNMKYLIEDVTSLPAKWTLKFDWVIMYDVLYDLPDHGSATKVVYRVLKNDGVASIADPEVHNSHRDNVGNPNVAGVGYAISTMICLPCNLSIDGAPGYGVGWGIETRRHF